MLTWNKGILIYYYSSKILKDTKTTGSWLVPTHFLNLSMESNSNNLQFIYQQMLGLIKKYLTLKYFYGDASFQKHPINTNLWDA